MENTEEKISYKVFWSGEEISTEYLAKFYENELDEIKKDNLLLGTFSADGKYSFSSETKKALIAIKKKIDDSKDNSYFVLSKATKSVFTFKMRIFEVDEDFLAANLYLIEVADDLRFEKPLKTFVAQYVDKNNSEFLARAKYVFNIVIDDDFLEKDKEENEEIIKPITIMETLDLQTQTILAKVFVEEMMQELENCGEKGKKVLEVLQAEKETVVEEGQEKPKEPNYIELKKKMLAEIEKNGGIKAIIDENPKIEEVVKKNNDRIAANKELDKVKEISMPEVKKEEKKEEKKEDKKAPAKKPAAKGDSGKSGSKPAKKSGGKPGGKKPAGKPSNKKDSNPDHAFAPIIPELVKSPQNLPPVYEKIPENKPTNESISVRKEVEIEIQSNSVNAIPYVQENNANAVPSVLNENTRDRQ